MLNVWQRYEKKVKVIIYLVFYMLYFLKISMFVNYSLAFSTCIWIRNDVRNGLFLMSICCFYAHF